MVTERLFGELLHDIFTISVFRQSYCFTHSNTHCLDDLPSCRVAQSHNHRHRGILRSVFHRLLQLFLYVFGQSFDVADHTKAHIILHKYLVFE